MPEDKPVKLPAELGTPLMVKLAKIADQLKCTLVGVDENSSLVVRLPAPVNNGWNIQEQMGCVVRFISNGTVYGFNTFVQGKLIKDPLRLMFIAFPTSLEILNLRQSKRIACHLPAVITVDSVDMQGLALDIGSGGVSFVHKLPDPDADPPNIYLGMEIPLRISLWGLAGEQTIICQVRNLNLSSESLALGMSFLKAEDAVSQCITGYVNKASACLDEGA